MACIEAHGLRKSFGTTAALDVDAKFVPLILTKAPGLMFCVPSVAFTMPRTPLVTAGVDTPLGVSGMTVRPESVRRYAT